MISTNWGQAGGAECGLVNGSYTPLPSSVVVPSSRVSLSGARPTLCVACHNLAHVHRSLMSTTMPLVPPEENGKLFERNLQLTEGRAEMTARVEELQGGETALKVAITSVSLHTSHACASTHTTRPCTHHKRVLAHMQHVLAHITSVCFHTS